jgi:hypothetical protein
MSNQLLTQIWNGEGCEHIKGNDLLVMLALADQASDEGYCWPSRKTIARRVRLSERGITQIIARLEALGHIRRVMRYSKTGQRSNGYYVYPLAQPCTPPLHDCAPPPCTAMHPEPSLEPSVKPIAATPDGLQTRGLSQNTSTMVNAQLDAPASSPLSDLAEEAEQAPNPEPANPMVEDQAKANTLPQEKNSIAPAPKPKKEKKPRERNAMYDAIEDVWGYMGARNVQYQRLLSGTPIAPFSEYVHEELKAQPVTPDELRSWAQWWKGQHPTLTLVSKPDTMPKSILEWRALQKPRQESEQRQQQHEARAAIWAQMQAGA